MSLLEGVTGGSPATATVSLTDNDAPGVTVAYAQSSYEAVEGGAGVVVTVQLSATPEREVVIPLTAITAVDAMTMRE